MQHRHCGKFQFGQNDQSEIQSGVKLTLPESKWNFLKTWQ